MHYVLQPGDIELVNNHTCLHHRTAFEDYEVRCGGADACVRTRTLTRRASQAPPLVSHACALRLLPWAAAVAQDVNEKRHLLRLWLSPPEERELPDVYEDLYGSTTVGNRGAIRVDGQVECVVEEAE